MSLRSTYDDYIRPNVCAFLITAAGIYFVTPMIVPMLSGIPIVRSLGYNARAALLGGSYAVGSVIACQQLGLV